MMLDPVNPYSDYEIAAAHDHAQRQAERTTDAAPPPTDTMTRDDMPFASSETEDSCHPTPETIAPLAKIWRREQEPEVGLCDEPNSLCEVIQNKINRIEEVERVLGLSEHGKGSWLTYRIMLEDVAIWEQRRIAAESEASILRARLETAEAALRDIRNETNETGIYKIADMALTALKPDDQQPAPPVLTYEQRSIYACKVCGNVPDEFGTIDHGRGCYTQNEDGGGSSWVDLSEIRETARGEEEGGTAT